MGNGGMVSFGHAAYFGLGCLWRGVHGEVSRRIDGMALLAGPLFAGLGALIFGWFCVRLSGVYMAMLTLAAAQIVWSTAFQWQEVTGGDDGLLGIWPSEWAKSKTAYYYLALALCGGGILLLRRMVFRRSATPCAAGATAPTAPNPSASTCSRVQWLAFIIAGCLCGYGRRRVRVLQGIDLPRRAGHSALFDALVMVLLGGVQTLSGPIVGAGVFRLLEDEDLRLNYWRAILGCDHRRHCHHRTGRHCRLHQAHGDQPFGLERDGEARDEHPGSFGPRPVQIVRRPEGGLRRVV
jgi:branched-chain amino acid transport system permease protein